MVYLFLGSDSLSKDGQLKALRQQVLTKETEQFNLDILYGKELALKVLQERLLSLPVRCAQRIIVIKNAQELKSELQEFILHYVKAPAKQILLVLDVSETDRKNTFINQLIKYAKTIHFKDTVKPDSFTLGRQIALRRPDLALRILHQLLQDGEKPERILGGLRYAWEREMAPASESKRRLRLLLNCDIEIKTGRLRPVFALEKLVISLCGLSKPFS